jgi:hypothetical protein
MHAGRRSVCVFTEGQDLGKARLSATALLVGSYGRKNHKLGVGPLHAREALSRRNKGAGAGAGTLAGEPIMGMGRASCKKLEAPRARSQWAMPRLRKPQPPQGRGPGAGGPGRGQFASACPLRSKCSPACQLAEYSCKLAVGDLCTGTLDRRLIC